jgi:hypothetical protein
VSMTSLAKSDVCATTCNAPARPPPLPSPEEGASDGGGGVVQHRAGARGGGRDSAIRVCRP